MNCHQTNNKNKIDIFVGCQAKKKHTHTENKLRNFIECVDFHKNQCDCEFRMTDNRGFNCQFDSKCG